MTSVSLLLLSTLGIRRHWTEWLNEAHCTYSCRLKTHRLGALHSLQWSQDSNSQRVYLGWEHCTAFSGHRTQTVKGFTWAGSTAQPSVVTGLKQSKGLLGLGALHSLQWSQDSNSQRVYLGWEHCTAFNGHRTQTVKGFTWAGSTAQPSVVTGLKGFTRAGSTAQFSVVTGLKGFTRAGSTALPSVVTGLKGLTRAGSTAQPSVVTGLKGFTRAGSTAQPSVVTGLKGFTRAGSTAQPSVVTGLKGSGLELVWLLFFYLLDMATFRGG